ncbi:TM0106 family RecB-like putative nuclease [Demequina rhizosphaerae]|uniref:TM0106 family RecB-like putative nuclease n=1 Tax=Demequina rhizosphaerae TaxID=1638985 RepID=UPI000A07D9E7|nr:TM0106 family RecB-like putative nuclease [Demequina rhizosphaerae]
MYLAGQTMMWSASDVVRAAECEYATLRRLDEVRGRSPRLEAEADAMLERAGALGDLHEADVLMDMRDALAEATGLAEEAVVRTWRPGDDETLPADVASRIVAIEAGADERRPTADELAAAARVSLSALEAGAAIVYQATVMKDGFHGFADFLLREDVARGEWTPDAKPRYVVADSKVARHVKTSALLQIGSYAAVLRDAGVALGDSARVILGTGEYEDFALGEVEAVSRAAMARFQATMASHEVTEAPVAWGDYAIAICGTCAYCEDAIEANDDLLQVANLRRPQRAKLHAAGLTTAADLAAATDAPAGMSRETFENLRFQAAMQKGAAPLGPDGGTVAYVKADETHHLSWSLISRSRIDALPTPSAGDVYFDFEGDPLWQSTDTGEWGIDYLFGLVTRPEAEGAAPPFTAFWAHDLRQEKRALKDFIAFVEERRSAYPDMHVYHYAPYEKTHLLSIAMRHQVCEDVVDRLLREGVFVDLLPVVRGSLRISAPSYSIKKLEPLYMGDHLRTGEVTDAATSVNVYADYCAAVEAGHTEVADRLLAGIADYNEYDCVSTLELDAWLRLRAAESSMPYVAPVERAPRESKDDAVEAEISVGPSVVDQIRDLVDSHDDEHGVSARSADLQALAMLGAAAEYADREKKVYWQDLIGRLQTPIDEWGESREHIPFVSVGVVEEWHDATRTKTGKKLTRVLEAEVDLPAGAKLDSIKSMYPGGTDHPGSWAPDLAEYATGGGSFSLATDDDGEPWIERRGPLTVLRLTERADTALAPEGWSDRPLAIVPGSPPDATVVQDAVREVAARALAAYGAIGACGESAALSLLRRADAALPVVAGHDYAGAIIDALAPASSCVSVQGPPGTGKTYTGSRVIAALVEHGWRVGVVGQSHSTVENMLKDVAKLPDIDAKAQVFKVGGPKNVEPWTWLDKIDKRPAQGGYVIGATAWGFAKLDAEELDLIVVDEAGQYSLAFTIAAGRAAARLLLLGDPQQLGQVSHATHPEHVDESALSWVAEDGLVPERRGYLLDTTYRMHSAVTAPVSRLSYRGKLHSAPSTDARRLEGIGPGLEVVMLDHAGNATSSVEEADAVVRQVERVIGRDWFDGETTRPIGEGDILVVAPFNAQVGLVRDRLAKAGYEQIEVGTVDRFQGREAPVAILTTATSSPAESPRGLCFVIERNRTNVAVSRAQWLAVIVRSRSLTAAIPTTPEPFVELGAFVRLCESGLSVSGDTRAVAASAASALV